MTSETIQLESGLSLTIDPAVDGNARPILLLPAMGVPASYYDPLVAGLNAAGHSIVRLHWRDEDRSFPKRHKDYGYADLAEVDIPAAAAYTREKFGADPVVLGHSLGGQVSVISAAKGGPYAGIVIAASGTNYWRGSGLGWALGVGFVSFIFAPLAVRIFGFWPGGRFGFGGRQCSRMIRDWARLGRTGKFLPEGASIDHEAALHKLELPVLALTVTNDHYVSPGASANLIEKLEHCHVEHTHWRAPLRENRGHFRWVKASTGPAEIIHEWAERVAPTSAA